MMHELAEKVLKAKQQNLLNVSVSVSDMMTLMTMAKIDTNDIKFHQEVAPKGAEYVDDQGQYWQLGGEDGRAKYWNGKIFHTAAITSNDSVKLTMRPLNE